MKPNKLSYGTSCAASGRRRLTLLVILALPLTVAAADPAGKIIYARGNVSAQAPGAGLRIVTTGAPTTVGDTIATAADSFAVIELLDEERITLRPETRFTIAEFNQTAGHESVALNLVKGGFRALTGLLGRRRPESFRLTTPVATIGIRGTDFVARFCGAECASDLASKAHVGTPVSAVVGRTLMVKGEVTINGVDGKERPVSKGTAIFVGDVVKAAPLAYAVLAFQDQTRVTLQPESEFKVEDYVHAPATPERESALFSLLRGGLRMATGLMASRRHDSLHVHTRVATIGIRGTGFDLVEGDECGGKPAAAGKPGMTAQVWKGGIALQESNATVGEGEAACLLERGQPVTRVEPKPDLGTPRPDEVPVPPDTFATSAASGDEPGLHVSVIDGQVVLTNETGEVDLARGEDGFAGSAGSAPVRAENERSVGRGDPFFSLSPGSPTESWDKFEGDFGLTCPVGS